MKTTTLQTRAAIGIGWPGITDGNVIAVEEEKRIEENFPKSPEVRTIYSFIDEYESEDMGKLIRKALEWQKKYGAQVVYARNHEPAMRFLETYNRDAYRTKQPLLTITEPPYSSDQGVGVKGVIDYHLARLREFLQPGREKLFDLPGSRVKAHLDDIPPDAMKIKDMDYPAPAALSYVMCGLELSADADREAQELMAMEQMDAWDD